MDSFRLAGPQTDAGTAVARLSHDFAFARSTVSNLLHRVSSANHPPSISWRRRVFDKPCRSIHGRM